MHARIIKLIKFLGCLMLSFSYTSTPLGAIEPATIMLISTAIKAGSDALKKVLTLGKSERGEAQASHEKALQDQENYQALLRKLSHRILEVKNFLNYTDDTFEADFGLSLAMVLATQKQVSAHHQTLHTVKKHVLPLAKAAETIAKTAAQTLTKTTTAAQPSVEAGLSETPLGQEKEDNSKLEALTETQILLLNRMHDTKMVDRMVATLNILMQQKHYVLDIYAMVKALKQFQTPNKASGLVMFPYKEEAQNAYGLQDMKSIQSIGQSLESFGSLETMVFDMVILIVFFHFIVFQLKGASMQEYFMLMRLALVGFFLLLAHKEIFSICIRMSNSILENTLTHKSSASLGNVARSMELDAIASQEALKFVQYPHHVLWLKIEWYLRKLEYFLFLGLYWLRPVGLNFLITLFPLIMILSHVFCVMHYYRWFVHFFVSIALLIPVSWQIIMRTMDRMLPHSSYHAIMEYFPMYIFALLLIGLLLRKSIAIIGTVIDKGTGVKMFSASNHVTHYHHQNNSSTSYKSYPMSGRVL